VFLFGLNFAMTGELTMLCFKKEVSVLRTFLVLCAILLIPLKFAFAQDLFVSNYSPSGILRFDGHTGTPINLVVCADTLSAVPTGVAVGPDGDLYVANTSAGQVLRFDSVTGAYKGVFAQLDHSNLPAGVVAATNVLDILFGPDGNLYACYDGSTTSLTPPGCIVRFSGTTGAVIDAFVPTGSGGLTDPRGLAFDASGDLYVSSDGGHQILRYSGSTGALLGVFVPNGPNEPEGPSQLRFGPDGNLYVACFYGNCVREYNGSTGEFISVFGQGVLSSPVGLGFGPDGKLYVSSSDYGSVKKINVATGDVTDFVPHGSNGLGQASYITFANAPNPPALRVGSLAVGRSRQSAWCNMSGYHDAIRQALPGVNVNFIVNDVLTPQFLNQIDIVLLGSVYNGANVPIAPLSSNEQQALYGFVAAGKAALLAGDSTYFDPANNSFFNTFGCASTGFYDGGFYMNVPDPSGNPLTNGPMGLVTAPIFGYAGWFAQLHPAAIPVAYLPNGTIGVAYIPRDGIQSGSGAVGMGTDISFTVIDSPYSENRHLFQNTVYYLAQGPRPPVASNQSVTVYAGWSVPVTLAAIDSLGLPLTYAIAASPANGALSGSAPNVTYTPNPGFVGTDSFTFKASDTLSGSSPATVSVNVIPDPRIVTTLTVTGATHAVGTAATVSSVLKRTNPSAALASATVAYKLDGALLGTRTTAANGSSSFSLIVPEPVGNHILTVEFAGDTQFRPISASANVVATAPLLYSLTVIPTIVYGGTASTGTVTLTGTAAVDTSVLLQSTDSAASVPASVTVLAGASSATFTITTSPVAANATPTISATLGSVTTSRNLTVKAPILSTLQLSPTSVTGGGNVTGTVTLTGTAAVDTPVTLANTNTKAALPASPVTIAAGTSSVSFTMTTIPTTTSVSGTVTATVGTITKSITLKVTP